MSDTRQCYQCGIEQLWIVRARGVENEFACESMKHQTFLARSFARSLALRWGSQRSKIQRDTYERSHYGDRAVTKRSRYDEASTTLVSGFLYQSQSIRTSFSTYDTFLRFESKLTIYTSFFLIFAWMIPHILDPHFETSESLNTWEYSFFCKNNRLFRPPLSWDYLFLQIYHFVKKCSTLFSVRKANFSFFKIHCRNFKRINSHVSVEAGP